MEQLYRAIVGSSVEPIMKGDAVPPPYRQTPQAPLAKQPEPPKQPENPSK